MHCTVLEVTTNVSKFTMTVAIRNSSEHICRPVLVGALLAPTYRLHFQSLHPLSFLFMCTLHWCKHCTVLEVTTNVLKFPMTALCGIAAHGHICRPVLVGALLVPTQGLHFQALHSLLFLFICTLHWYKQCTMLEIAANMRKFPMTALCGIAAQELICTPVLVGTIFTPTQG